MNRELEDEHVEELRRQLLSDKQKTITIPLKTLLELLCTSARALGIIETMTATIQSDLHEPHKFLDQLNDSLVDLQEDLIGTLEDIRRC